MICEKAGCGLVRSERRFNGMQEKADKRSDEKSGEQDSETMEPERPERLDKEHGEEVPPPREKKGAP
jgi:hypothetical protein